MTLADFIGKRWEAWAEGPEAFDCWTLTREAALGLYGITFPAYTFDRTQATAILARCYLAETQWQALDGPRAGAVMACGSTAGVRHVALCVSAREVLNIIRATRSGVCQIADLSRAFAVVRFYACNRS